MPVSKKRKKDGKPVHRATPPAVEGESSAHHPDPKGAPREQRLGRPSNPFVSQQQSKRGAQRGR